MVDFHKLQQHFLTDVYKESPRTYKTSKNFIRRIQTAPVREDGDEGPRLRSDAKSCSEECFCINQKLSERRRIALMAIDDLAIQKKQLLDQEEAFQRRFIEFNELVILNEQKRERAVLRYDEFETLSGGHTTKIEKLLSEVLKLRQYKDKLMREIKKHLIYEEFLQPILSDFGAKASLHDVVARYITLQSKKNYLILRTKTINDNLKKMYQESLFLLGNYHEKVIKMKSLISVYVVRYDEAVKRTSRLESLLTSLWDHCAQKLEDMVLSVQSIRNLNEMMQKRPLARERSEGPHKETLNMPHVICQIVTIKNTMKCLIDVMEKVEVRLNVMKKVWSNGDHAILEKSTVL